MKSIKTLNDIIASSVEEAFSTTLRPVVIESKSKGPENVVEADKDGLNPKSMMDRLEKRKDEEKPNISKEKMQVVFPSKEQVIRADVKHILMMLNMMRSGKSLKKSDTRRQLQDYYGTLNAGEKQALFSIISGLTQILAAGVPGREAVDPSYISLDISPRSKTQPAEDGQDETNSSSTSSPVEPPAPLATPPDKRVFKQTTPVGPKNTSKQRGQPDDTPIVVGEAADKSRVMQIFEMHRKA